jgi:radical SAM superfamily enzyme YgiQ (UPF0313 family)
MYRTKNYRLRSLQEIFDDLEKAQNYYLSLGIAPRKVFLCDGDALVAPMSTLLPVVKKTNELFPSLKRIGVYATAQNILDKSNEDLVALADEKLSIAYIGLESGCDKVLHRIVKGNTNSDMKESFLKLRECGWQSSVITMLGIGGKELSDSHCSETAKLISATAPDFLSFLTTVAIPNTPYMTMVEREQTDPLTSLELLEEMRAIISNINCVKGKIIFRANHVSNQFPLGGILPRDKEKLVKTLDEWIAICPPGVYPENNPGQM